jgi:hypothetical protein
LLAVVNDQAGQRVALSQLGAPPVAGGAGPFVVMAETRADPVTGHDLVSGGLLRGTVPAANRTE